MRKIIKSIIVFFFSKEIDADLSEDIIKKKKKDFEEKSDKIEL